MDVEKILRLFSSLTVLLVALVLVLFGAVVLYKIEPDLFIRAKSVDAATWQPKSVDTDLPPGADGQLIKYGYLLIAESPKWMGPMLADEDMRYAGNNLACKNCHLEAGTKPGSASWVGVTDRFPQFRGRENEEGTIEDRINGCMERSMNGRKLPEESKQMEAIVAYMEWLSEDVPEERQIEHKGFPKLDIPEFAADLVKGKAIYAAECEVCHGTDGQGVRLADSVKGYQYPPLWGGDSYNHGAGMNRVLTAAQFIKGNMPFGQATWDNPKLTDEEAFHVAAYIDSFDRPLKSNVEEDFPDRKLKPVSTPYGPWADDFSAEQHKYGPFPPIIEYYKEQYGITKTK